MGAALEVVTGSLSAAAVTTAQAFAANSPGSFTVRATNGGSMAHLLNAWGNLSGAGQLRIRSPRLHDAQQAISLRAIGSVVQPLIQDGFDQELYSQDTLTVEALFDAAPTAATEESMGMLVYYDDLGGANARLRHWAEIAPAIESYYVQEALPVTGAAGAWGAGYVINSAYDDWKANRDYALIGYTTSDACTAVAISGSDTGNYYVGGPGPTNPHETRDFFKKLSDNTGKACIPVINAANKLSTQVYAVSDAGAATIHVGLIFALLKG